MKYVIGIDEAGRGAWAGPFAAAAVCFVGDLPHGLKDSKQLSNNQREHLYKLLREETVYSAVVFVEPADIDKYGLTWTQTYAMGLALQKVVKQLAPTESDSVQVIIDGNINYLEPNLEWDIQAVTKADTLFAEVMAASILAKVERDQKMRELAKRYAQYGFDTHVGYGTRQHREALARYGVTKVHRRSYRPIKGMQ